MLFWTGRPFAALHTPRSTLVCSVNLMNMSLDCGIKPRCADTPHQPLAKLLIPPPTEYLDIVAVDMMSQEGEVNKQQHRTMFYNSTNLIVRRGQEFLVKLTFSRPYNPKGDKFALEFVIGKQSPPHPLFCS